MIDYIEDIKKIVFLGKNNIVFCCNHFGEFFFIPLILNNCYSAVEIGWAVLFWIFTYGGRIRKSTQGKGGYSL